VSSGELLKTWPAAGGALRLRPAFSTDGKRLAYLTFDNTEHARLIVRAVAGGDVSADQPLGPLRNARLEFLGPDRMAIAGDHFVRILDAKTGRGLLEWPTGDRPLSAVAGGGGRLATAQFQAGSADIRLRCRRSQVNDRPARACSQLRQACLQCGIGAFGSTTFEALPTPEARIDHAACWPVARPRVQATESHVLCRHFETVAESG
jgi:hypothetical protein